MTPFAALVLALTAQEARQARPLASMRDEFVRVEVVCTALSGSSVYLDLGRAAGFAPGDRLRIFPLEGAPRRGKISSVSRTSSRAELVGGLAGLEIGLRGEVWVPRQRLQAVEEAEGASRTEPAQGEPEGAPPAPLDSHPPWTSPPEEWNSDLPLLAPAHGLAPEDRPRRFQGRVFTSLDWTGDSAGDEEREFVTGGLGFEGRIENPFAHGGALALDAELFGRRSDTAGDEEGESRLRIDRASYAWGGVRGARHRGEAGRFLQRELPALGFLDGVELLRHLGDQDRIGASFGFLPIPDDLFRSGDDLQAALFYRRTSGEAQRYSLAAGYQKTWHEGTADRDLFVTELELHPSASSALFSSALIDYYTASDEIKGSGPELTQLFVNASHRTPAGHGLGLFLSRLRWPELERDEFPDVTAAEIAAAVSTRYGADAWLALGQHTQLYGRADAWSDQDDSGSGGRARITWRDLFRRGDLLLIESFTSSGKFSNAVGLRTSVRRRLEYASIDLSWDATLFEQENVDEDLLQHAARGGLEFALGASWFLALYVESRFGDEQDAISLGFLLQRSFD